MGEPSLVNEYKGKKNTYGCVSVARIKKTVPMAAPHLDQVRDMFERYDVDHDDTLSINEVATLLAELGNKITSLPAVCPPLHCLFCIHLLFVDRTSGRTTG
jgi:hypothetical protein